MKPPPLRPPRLHPARVLRLVLPPALACLLVYLLAPAPARASLAVLAPLLTLAVSLGLVLHRRLSRRLGSLAALLTLSTSLALLALTLALLAPSCPSRTVYAVSTRCTPAEAAQLSLATMLAPVALFVVLAPLVRLLRLLLDACTTHLAPRLVRRSRPARPLKRQTPR